MGDDDDTDNASKQLPRNDPLTATLLEQIMEETTNDSIDNNVTSALQIIYIYPFENDDNTRLVITSNIVDEERTSFLNIENINFATENTLKENGFINESTYSPDLLYYIISFQMPLLPCIAIGLLGARLNHDFPTTSNYAESPNAIWGTRIPLLRQNLGLDNFTLRLLKIRNEEYQRLIAENIIALGKERLKEKE